MIEDKMTQSQKVIPTSFLPPIYYFSIIKNESFLIDIFESYPKQTIRNRCTILSANGPLKLSIPILKYSNHTVTRDIRIDTKGDWHLRMWRAFEASYNRSAYFEYYKDDFRKLIFDKKDFLVDYNHSLLEWIMKKIKINQPIQYSRDFIPINKTKDYRVSLSSHASVFEHNEVPYFQVFEDKFGFVPNLSIIDLIFSQGPQATSFIK